MDETTVIRTKSAINLLLDVYQAWIEFAPDYDIPERDLQKLQKKLVKTRENIDKIYKVTEDMAKNNN